jgi:hypothetical protein
MIIAAVLCSSPFIDRYGLNVGICAIKPNENNVDISDKGRHEITYL